MRITSEFLRKELEQVLADNGWRICIGTPCRPIDSGQINYLCGYLASSIRMELKEQRKDGE